MGPNDGAVQTMLNPPGKQSFSDGGYFCRFSANVYEQRICFPIFFYLG
jgi:hypothetical protein